MICPVIDRLNELAHYILEGDTGPTDPSSLWRQLFATYELSATWRRIKSSSTAVGIHNSKRKPVCLKQSLRPCVRLYDPSSLISARGADIEDEGVAIVSSTLGCVELDFLATEDSHKYTQYNSFLLQSTQYRCEIHPRLATAFHNMYTCSSFPLNGNFA